MEVVHYKTEDNIDIFQKWLDALRDNQARITIARRIDRAALGNLGDHKSCRDGVSEMRINSGPGYRVYFFRLGDTLVVLLCAGDKKSQNADIDRAVAYKADFLKRIAR